MEFAGIRIENRVYVGPFFTAGKAMIGFYLGHSALTSAYGAAASVVVFLIWIYYSSQILLFGAELTRAYAFKYGRAQEGSRWETPPEILREVVRLPEPCCADPRANSVTAFSHS
jgi:hypothetical protein